MNKQITQCISTFIEGGDTNDVKRLDQILHKDYRNIQSGFFSKKGTTILNKTTYIELIRTKTFGGVKRQITYNALKVQGDLAYADVHLESKTMIFHSLITLIKEDKQWYIIGNYPHFTFK